MYKTCDKCLTCIPEEYFIQYGIYQPRLRVINLCLQCNSVYQHTIDRLMFEFLENDYGKFPIDDLDKNMIEARKRRSLGKNPWPTKEDESILQKISL